MCEPYKFCMDWSCYLAQSKGGGVIKGWGCLKKDDPGIPSVEQVARDTAIEFRVHSVMIGDVEEVTEADYLECIKKRTEVQDGKT